MNTRRSQHLFLFLAGLAVLLLAALAYVPGLPGDFVFDDMGSIVNNPALKDIPQSPAALLLALLSAPVGGLLRPISTLSFMLDARLFGFAPIAFKLTNIAIHLAAGVVFWFLAREVLRAYGAATGRKLDEQTLGWLSLAASGLWLVHPLNLTSVLYTVQRDNSLAAIFTATAMLTYLAGRRRERESGGGLLLIWVITPLLVLLGVLCKENAALVPVFLFVAEITLLRFQGKDGASSRHARAFMLVFLVVPAIAACVLAARSGFFRSGYETRDFTLYQRLLSESRFLLDYLRWSFVPDLRQLGLFHDDLVTSRGLLQPWTTLPSLVAVLALIAAALRWRQRFPLLSFGVLWFFAGHLLESTVLPLELVFEHRNYVPLFGLVLGCVGTAYPTEGEPAQRRLVKAGLAGCLGLMAMTTALRAHDWRTELSFARSEALHHPGSARAHAEVQWAYMAYIISTRDTSLVPETVAAAEASKALDPGSINQDIGLAYMFAVLGDLPRARLYLQSAAERGHTARPSSTMQLALQSLLQLTAPAQEPLRPDIGAVFAGALANPNMQGNPCDYAEIWNTYALFLESTGEITRALAGLHRAVSLCPGNVLIHVNFADMLLRYGDTRDAAVQIEALEKIHSFRYLAELQRLRQAYALRAGPVQ